MTRPVHAPLATSPDQSRGVASEKDETIEEVAAGATVVASQWRPRQKCTGNDTGALVYRTRSCSIRALWATNDSRDLYFIENPALGLIKVGIASDVANRLTTLEKGCGVPLTLLRVVPEGACYEGLILDALRDSRRLGEWFAPTPELRAIIADPDSILEFLAYTEDARRSGGVL